MREEEDQDSISVNWLEQTKAGTLDDCLEAVRVDLANVRTIKQVHRLAVLNVGEALAALRRKRHMAIEFRHDPKPGNPSHAGIYGAGVQDHAVGIILQEAVMHVADAMPSAKPSPP